MSKTSVMELYILNNQSTIEPMITVSRNFLVIFLVLLQLFAPLVHAHVDEPFLSNGLHLPGLENPTAALNTPTLHAQQCTFSSNHLVVSIESGVKDKHLKNHLNNDNGDYIHQAAFVFNAVNVATDSNFSPHVISIAQSSCTPLYAPRAPPLI
ncbi:MAG: hypothetical protein HOP02_14375 [Methylococcaceae bacterium]|nr:hypothetical protein [Methylococcaceae bacterium]